MAKIKQRPGSEAWLESRSRSGQFDIVVDGSVVASRGGNPLSRILFGAGFPDFDQLIDRLERRR